MDLQNDGPKHNNNTDRAASDSTKWARPIIHNDVHVHVGVSVGRDPGSKQEDECGGVFKVGGRKKNLSSYNSPGAD